MKTLYYLESETRQKLKDFHKEKAYERLQKSANEHRPYSGPFHLVWTALVQLAHLPRRILRPSQHHHEQSITLERSLDEAEFLGT